MIWEITFLLASFSVLIIAQRAGPDSPEEEYLEELHKISIVKLISLMPTLDSTEIGFHPNDVKYLTTECNVNEECLNNKKESVQKFHQKMQAIQCVNGLYVLNVLDELKPIMDGMKEKFPSIHGQRAYELFHEPIKYFKFYLSSMLAVLLVAQWDPYAWQIELFTFLSGLAASEVNVEIHVEHYKSHNIPMRKKVSAFVDQCAKNGYLFSPNDTATNKTTVFEFVESIYKSNEIQLFPNYLFLYYTVKNLMLRPLYLRDDFIFDWSSFKIKLDTSVVSRQMRTQLGFYRPEHSIDKWRLDPIGGNKYSVLIAKHIHLRAEFMVWFHLNAYLTLLSRLLDVTDQNDISMEKVNDSWKNLASELKCILRAVGFKENIYWSALNIMMVDLRTIGKDELAAREMFTRKMFCQSAKDLGLASYTDMDRQLQKLEIPEDYNSIYDSIESNARKAKTFCSQISSTLNGRFIRILVAAEGNETFVMH